MCQDILRHRVLIGLMVLLLVAHGAARAGSEMPERIPWQKVPIELVLPVGAERRIDFPGPVRIGLPESLSPLLRVQSVADSVYLLAHEPFGSTRVMVRAIDSGRIYLLDLSASEAPETSDQPVVILDPEAGGADEAGDRAGSETNAGPSYGYVALTRFAAQQLYAPARLLRDLPGVVRVPVRRNPVALVRGGAVSAEPLVAWRAGGLYLTALKLTNRTDEPQTLDPRTLRGDWLTATFQHSRLQPAGNEADTTAVYLISARPFETAL